MPFIQILGYDVFNPLEVVPEMDCDIVKKKGEKIDYAIMKAGSPIMLIECKHWKQDLNLHDNQLTALPDDIGQLTALQVRLQETQPTSDPLSKKMQPHRPRMYWSCSSQGLGAPGFSTFTTEMPRGGVSLAVWAVGISPPNFWHVRWDCIISFHNFTEKEHPASPPFPSDEFSSLAQCLTSASCQWQPLHLSSAHCMPAPS